MCRMSKTVLAILLSLTTACTAETIGDPNTKSSQATPGNQHKENDDKVNDDKKDEEVTGEVVFDNYVDGTWRTDCLKESRSTVSQRMLDFDTQSLTKMYIVYKGEECVEGNESLVEIEKGNLVEAFAIDGAFNKMSFELSSFEVTVVDPALIGGYNEFGVYGRKDWKAGETKDVIGHLVSKGENMLTIYSEINGNTMQVGENEAVELPDSYTRE